MPQIAPPGARPTKWAHSFVDLHSHEQILCFSDFFQTNKNIVLWSNMAMNNQPFIVDPPSYKLPCIVDVPAMFHTRLQLVDTEKWFHSHRLTQHWGELPPRAIGLGLRGIDREFVWRKFLATDLHSQWHHVTRHLGHLAADCGSKSVMSDILW